MKSVMHALGVIPNQIIYDFVVEDARIKKIGFVKIHEFFPQRPVKPFAVSVHLGSARVGMIMGQMQFFKLGGKLFGEFRPVVR